MCFIQTHKKGNMAKFKCKHTGCVYEWTDEQTILDMRKHSEYSEEVSPEPKPTKKPTPRNKLDE
jgi:hypothetical protein